jgi:Short C-terminal domain
LSGTQPAISKGTGKVAAVAIPLTSVGIAVFVSSIYWLVLIGGCASGPGRVGDSCPSGTWVHGFGILGGLALVGIGVGLLKAITGPRYAVGRVARRLMAIATAGALIYAAFGPDTRGGSGEKILCVVAAAIVAVVAMPGVAPRPRRTRTAAEMRAALRARGRAAPTSAPPRSGRDAGPPVGEGLLDRIEQLADLRDRGALTAEEFEAQKARLLGDAD